MYRWWLSSQGGIQLKERLVPVLKIAATDETGMLITL